MADRNNDSPPPLEDTNKRDNICARNYSEEEDDKLSETSDDSDRDTKIPSFYTPLDIDDESSSYVGHMIDHLDPESPDSSRSNSPEPRSDTGPDDNITN